MFNPVEYVPTIRFGIASHKSATTKLHMFRSIVQKEPTTTPTQTNANPKQIQPRHLKTQPHQLPQLPLLIHKIKQGHQPYVPQKHLTGAKRSTCALAVQN